MKIAVLIIVAMIAVVLDFIWAKDKLKEIFKDEEGTRDQEDGSAW